MTVLNPAPAAGLLPGLLELADVIVPNETELALLTGSSVGTLLEVEAAARRLLHDHAKAVVVTLGSRGALLVTRSAAVHHQPRSVAALDSTGAGDAFIGALVARLVRDDGLSAAVGFANAAAAISVTRAGTQTSFATPEEINAALSES